MTNWLTGWGYRRSHDISAQAGAGDHYQVCIKVYKSGTDNGTETVNGITAGKVSCDGHCRDDFGDIRFTDNDGDTLLDHWMETLVSGTSAVFWVEVADSLESATATIYVYYSKADATDVSNITNTFLFGDDFSSGSSPDASKWTVAGSPTVSGGICTLTAGQNIKGKTNVGPSGVCWHSRANYESQANLTIGIHGLTDAANEAEYYYMGEVKYARSIKAGSSTVTTITIAVNTYHIFDIFCISSSSVKFNEDGSQVAAHTTNITTTAIPVFHYSRTSYGPTVNVDYTFVRKYVSPEPVHSTWGSQEAEVTIVIPTVTTQAATLIEEY